MKKQDSFNKLFDNGISYKEYFNKSDKYLERMDTSFKAGQKAIQNLIQDQISRMNEKLHVLCIAENWCIDCANGVPIIALLSDMNPNWNFRIISREDYLEEFELFYTTVGRRKIPVIIFADGDGDEIMRWVERPMRSYLLLGALRDQNLPKIELIQKYNDTLELKPPFVSEEILTELVSVAEKSASIIHVNSTARKHKTTIT